MLRADDTLLPSEATIEKYELVHRGQRRCAGLHAAFRRWIVFAPCAFNKFSTVAVIASRSRP